MANYLGWEITNKGRELLARAMNNETKINVTKFKIGAGYNTGNDRELTDLLDKRNEFPVNSYERKENGNVEFTFIVSNKTGSGTSAITNSYKISEMGIYARDDFGTEILYAYNKGTDGDYIPVFNGKNAIDIMEKCIIVVDQSANLNVTIDSSNTYITKDSAERNYVKKTDFAEENKAGIISLSAVKGLIPNVPNATEYANGTVNLRQIKDIIDTKVPNATHDTVGKVMLGTTANTVLEGKRLAEIIGLEFGGNLQDYGRKEKGKFYYDTANKKYYECIENNNLTYNDTAKFRAISNKSISDKVENLLEIRQTISASNPNLGTVKFFRLGKRVTFFVYFQNLSGFAMTDGTKIADFQENFFPDDFFRETEHAIMNRNNAGTENARLVIRSDGIYVYGVNGKTHYELKGSLHYIAR
jgi:hypothetical protein